VTRFSDIFKQKLAKTEIATSSRKHNYKVDDYEQKDLIVKKVMFSEDEVVSDQPPSSERPKPKVRVKSVSTSNAIKHTINPALAKMISKSVVPTSSRFEYMSKDEMRHLLRTEYAGITPEILERNFKDCCSEHERCSEDLMKIADAITALYRMKPDQFAGRVQDMELALQRKCAEIKKQRSIIHRLLSQAAVETRENGCQNVALTKNSET
jgi:hypothetical protein